MLSTSLAREYVTITAHSTRDGQLVAYDSWAVTRPLRVAVCDLDMDELGQLDAPGMIEVERSTWLILFLFLFLLAFYNSILGDAAPTHPVTLSHLLAVRFCSLVWSRLCLSLMSDASSHGGRVPRPADVT